MISIIKTTPSSISLQFEDKTVKVCGESFARGYSSPDFIIDRSSIKKWDPPFESVSISESERESIVQYLLEELARRNWIVTAE